MVIGADASSEWYRALYGPDYRASVAGLLTPERTAREVDFVLDITGLTPPGPIADVASGWGRHAVELATQGYDVIDVDLNPTYVNAARRLARMRGIGSRTRFLVRDMRQILPGPFALVQLLFMSFGFFSDQDNFRVLSGWASALKPGGIMLLDVWNGDGFNERFRPHEVWQANLALTVEGTRAYDPSTRRLAIRYTYRYRDGACRTYDALFRLYTRTELTTLLQAAGLDVWAWYGSLIGESWTSSGRRTVVLARRPTQEVGSPGPSS